MKYIGILWNTISELEDLVITDINEMATVTEVHELDLSSQYENFVRTIYEHDGIDKWKIDKKLEGMNSSNNQNVVILFIDVDDSERVFNSNKNKEVITNIEALKKYIRTKYSQLIPNYYFDNVFHMTDNEEEVYSTLYALQKIRPEIVESYKETLTNEEKGLVRERKI